jgi:polypeptide N-acetylgalactosaminyltransferase
VSIIIVFFDEHPSLLKRTLHSVYNRTPHKLIHEIILVNDNSTSSLLYEPFEKYVINNFAEFVKIHVLTERRGMTVARMEGARYAKGEVLVNMACLHVVLL